MPLYYDAKNTYEYYKYGEADIKVSLSDSDNTTNITDGSFVTGRIYNKTLTQTYTLNSAIEDNTLRLSFSSTETQQNATWVVTVTAITDSGEIEVFNQDWGKGVMPVGDYEVTAPTASKILGIKINASISSPSSSYVYGNMTLSVYKRSILNGTADEYDYIVTIPPKPVKELHLGSQKIALGLLNNELVYCSYNATQTICDVSNGETWSGTLARGVYYVRAQGAGGGGGNNNYSNNGGGGGSGAGFEGYINLTSPIETTVTTGAGGANSSAGADTVIGEIMTLGGGKGGGSGVAGTGGVLTTSETVTIIKSTIQSDGEDGNFSNAGSGSRCYGGNSVLTGDGRGDGAAAATKPGAGGGGQIQWGAAGQPGMYGECLIKLVGVY